MSWTKEQIDQIPAVYRDFLMALKPIIDSRKSGSALKITSVPSGQILGFLRTNYGYGPDEIRQISRNLKERGLVEEDKFGFFVPTPKGERLIRAIAEETEPVLSEVPPMPEI